MNYLRSYTIFESFKYENSEITENGYIFTDINTLEFTDYEFNTLRRFFAQYNTKVEKLSKEDYKYVVATHRNIYFQICKLEDYWFYVYYNNYKTAHYYKCDQMGGMIEILTNAMKNYKKVDPDEYISNQDKRMKISKLKNDLIKKIRTLGVEDLEKLSNQLLKESLILESKYENQIITEEEWEEHKEKLIFTKKELDKIKDYFLTLNIPEKTFSKMLRFIKEGKRGSTEGFNIKDVNLVILDRIRQKGSISYYNWVYIEKIDDDWFLVKKEGRDDDYYKCDTIDGLMEFIKSITTHYENKDLALLKKEILKKISNMTYEELLKLNASI